MPKPLFSSSVFYSFANVFYSFANMGLGLVTLSFFSGPALSQASANLNVNATVLIPLSVLCGTALSFGSIDTGVGNGTIVLAPTGNVSSGDQFTLPDIPAQAGSCALDGEDGSQINLTINPVTLVHSTDNTQTLLVDNFDLSGAGIDGGDGNDFQVTLQNGGAQNINIGASLYLTGGEIPGAYQGTGTVTIDYP